MTFKDDYENLMSFIPVKESSRFKAILAGYKSLTVKDKLQEGSLAYEVT